MITIKDYVRVKSLEEAWQLNQNRMNRILGGMLWMRLGNGMVNTAIDLSELGLDFIKENEEEFSIGAMASLRDLEVHEGLNRYSNDAVKKCSKGYCRGTVSKHGHSRRKYLGTFWIF